MKLVYSVGQCGFDHAAISEVLKPIGAQVVNISGKGELLKKISGETPDLILINRRLDADGSSGHEIIRDLKRDPLTNSIPVMLVSNYADAQEEARQLGALPGFGKNSLGSPELTEQLKQILEA